MGVQTGERIIIGYGMGKAYWEAKAVLGEQLRLDYVMDRRWEDSEDIEFDGIPILRLEQLRDIRQPLIVLFPRLRSAYEEIRRILRKEDAEVRHLDELFTLYHIIDGAHLSESSSGYEWHDDRDNHVFANSVPGEGTRFLFVGRHNTVQIGSSVTVGGLRIDMGSCGRCTIGAGTTIHDGWICVSGASVDIGEACLFSSQVNIKTNDGHHIFDMKIGNRINAGKDIRIGNHVWVGYGATLLGGADIDSGSIVGEQAVTSAVFGKNMVVAGNPARVIREDVLWSEDNTSYFDRQRFEDCMDQSARKYL